MKPRQVVLLALLAAVALFVAWLALRNPKPPWLPGDPEHETFVSAHECLKCHGPDGPIPQSLRHPVGRDCLRCHGDSYRNRKRQFG